jgi:hypothetical protein
MLKEVPKSFDASTAGTSPSWVKPDSIISICYDRIRGFGHESIHGKAFSRVKLSNGDVILTWAMPDELAAHFGLDRDTEESSAES